MMLELNPAPRLSECSERMDVAFAGPIPVAELDSDLERRARRSHELGLVKAEHVVELLDVRQSRFADADGSDLVRFDQCDAVRIFRQTADQPCGGHPAGGSSAEDDEAKPVVMW